MTSCLLSAILILTPAPIAPRAASASSEGFLPGSVVLPVPAEPGYYQEDQLWPATSMKSVVAAEPPSTLGDTSTTIPSALTPLPASDESPPPIPPSPTVLTDAQLYRLRMCESTDRYDVDTGNGYFGAYQWDLPTWNGVARRHMPWLVDVKPNLAWPAEQDAMTRWLWSERGRFPWPVCGLRVGAP